MREIKLLDKDTIDKIAAGEVVDRPASVVKELVENSIDAGSSSISIEIKDGGISLIRITDNGSGIEKNQIATAFLRHSTSKISNADDLSFIHTLGFRGEALSSIAAVSRMELCTKTQNDLTGIIYKIEGGVEQSISDAGLPNGTTIIVKDLFFNTPARLKFLKTPQTEAGYITDIVQRIAISHPEISFKYVVNGSAKLVTSGNGSCKDAIYGVFGRDITANLLDVELINDFLSIEGFIGKPELARGNRNFEFFFINGRYIKDRVISKAVEDAFAGFMMKGMFPFAMLNMKLEPELVDVNVHPSKMEVRFYNQEGVYDSIFQCVRERLTRRENIPVFSFDRKINDYTPVARPERAPVLATTLAPAPEKNKVPEVVKQYIPEPFEEKEHAAFNEDLNYKTVKIISETFEQQTVFEEKFLSSEAKAKHRIIGDLFDTYWLVEFNDSLYVIDQHAAHEKVLYEKFLKEMQNGTNYSQSIMPSIIVTLSSSEEIALNNYLSEFEELGFHVEHFGGNEYSISSIPNALICKDYRTFFVDILNEIAENQSGTSSQLIKERIASAACKAAVKGGNKISLLEADHLISELLTLDNPYNCPHGRPTIITMTKSELEKKFKRII